jgi:hypothetical protein
VAPQLNFTNGCHYEVMWDTEFACPEDYLLSQTCRLNDAQHGVEVDITPLASAPGETLYAIKSEVFVIHSLFKQNH